MARMAKMENCPTCGATISKNLADRLKANEPGYVCPGTSTKSDAKAS